jgi:predicted nucleic acid-binding Zn ribbon protein
MADRIPQHKHCRQCGKAFIGDEQYCSAECGSQGKDILKKRKRQLIILYVLTMFILCVAVIAMGL